MLSNHGSATAQEAPLQTTWASDLAEPVVVRVSQQGLRALLQSSASGKTALSQAQVADLTKYVAEWPPFYRVQPLPQQSSGLSSGERAVQEASKKKHQGQEEEPIAQADSSRRQMESPRAPVASAPSVAGCGACGTGLVTDAPGPR